MNTQLDVLNYYINKFLIDCKEDDYWRYFCSINNLMKFITYNEYNMTNTQIQFINAINYRKKLYKLSYLCYPCIINSSSHFIKSLGLGKENRGIIYLCPGKATNTDVFLLTKHLCIELDKLTNTNGFNGKIIWIMDFSFYTLSKAFSNLNVGIEFIKLINTCYPNIIEKFILINMPSYYKPILKILTPFMNENMKNSLVYCNDNEEIYNIQENYNNQIVPMYYMNYYCTQEQINKYLEYHNI